MGKRILLWLLYAVQGAIVGIGAILPGVSGGVLSVAFGVYEPMMELLTHPIPAIKKHFELFVPFGIGWILGFLLLAKGIGRSADPQNLRRAPTRPMSRDS